MAAFVGQLGMSPTTRGCLVPNWPVPCPICRVPVSSSCGQRTFWVPTCPIPYPISLFFVSLSDQNGYQPVPAHFPVPSVCLGHIGYKPVPSRFPFLIPISICISHSPFYIPIFHFHSISHSHFTFPLPHSHFPIPPAGQCVPTCPTPVPVPCPHSWRGGHWVPNCPIPHCQCPVPQLAKELSVSQTVPASLATSLPQ